MDIKTSVQSVLYATLVIAVTSCGGESNHQSTTTTILTTTRVSDALIKKNPLNEAPPVRHKPEIIEADNNRDGVMDSVDVYTHRP